jgi:hypothetical protein
MKNLLLILVFVLAISCTYDNISTKSYPPPQISQPLLVGSWKMETNRGVDVSFDVVEYGGKSWTKHTILGYNGKTTVLAPDDSGARVPITEPIMKSPTGSIQLLMWADRSYYSDAENEVSFYSLQPNTSYTQLIGKLGYSVVFGLDSNTSIPPLLDTINFKSPIIINKVK